MQAGLFIYLFIVWRGVAFRVAFMGHWGGTLVAFTAFAAFRVHWGGNLVAFTVLVGFYWASGLDVCGAFQHL